MRRKYPELITRIAFSPRVTSRLCAAVEEGEGSGSMAEEGRRFARRAWRGSAGFDFARFPRRFFGEPFSGNFGDSSDAAFDDDDGPVRLRRRCATAGSSALVVSGDSVRFSMCCCSAHSCASSSVFAAVGAARPRIGA